MFRVLVVCTGNICRSPMGEGILKKLLAEDGLAARTDVRSAGTWAVPGSAASQNGVKTAAAHGVDIQDHRSRPLTRSLLEDADLVLTMEPAHLAEALALLPSAAAKSHVITRFADPGGDPAGVEDPIGGDEQSYAISYEEIDLLMKKALPRLKALIAAKGSAPGEPA